jgi:hypothetical protein
MYSTTVQLPSRGKIGESHASIRTPKILEIREFIAAQQEGTTALNQFIDSLVDINIGDYTLGDRDYLFLTLRGMINPKPLRSSFKCDCGEQMLIVKEVDEIEVKQLPNDFQKSVEIPISGGKLRLKPFLVKDEISQKKYLDLRKTSDGEEPHQELGNDIGLFVRYALMVDNGCSIDENIDLLKNLDYTDFEKVVLYDLAFTCGPKLFSMEVCTACKRPWKVTYPIKADFLGISINSLLTKHRFLSKTTNIGFKDFLDYTTEEMDEVVKAEVELKKKNKK